MTVRHLKIFITVVDCGKMREAANRLYISQPSVSQAIQELENHYGIKLFERLSQKLYITEQGKKLLPYARHIVDSFENMDLMMKNTSERPRLRIGGSVSVGTFLLNHIIDEIEKEVQQIDIDVVVNNTETIEEKVKNSQLDVAIVEGMVTSKELVTVPIYEDELVIIVGKGHELFDVSRITLDELEKQILISREEGSVSRNQYEQLLIQKGCQIKRKWSCTSTEAIKQTVIRGRGLAIISNMLIGRELQEGKLRILSVEHIKVSRAINLIYHKDKFISTLMKQFIETCKALEDDIIA